MRIIIPLLVTLLILPTAAFATTLFKSGFEYPVTMSDWIPGTNWRKETTGADQGYDWETDFISTDSYWNIILNRDTYPDPDECIWLDITSDEAHSGSRSLYMKVVKQCKYNSVQARVAHHLGIHWPHEEAHIKYWLKFPADLDSRFGGGGVLLNEVRLSDFRIAFDVTSANGPLQFGVWAEPTSSGWDPLWVVRSDEPVPLGEWFHIEIYFKPKTYAEGGGAYWVKINGKKIIEIIPTPTRRICGSSETSETCGLPYSWNMIKLYTYTDNIEAWLDDFELYDTYTPGGTPVYECNDGTDNDGDVQTDYPDDTGCSSSTDNDETDCGDDSCEGGETCSSCEPDCGTCQPGQSFLPDAPVEAEAGTLTAPMTAGSDTLASGGSYIFTSTQHQGSADYAFDIADPGDYMMEARIIAPTVGDDSFYVGLDGEQVQGDNNFTWDTIETTEWAWVNVSLRGPGGNDTYAEFDPMVWTLPQGQHTFTIFGRETGTLLDQLILRPLSQEPNIIYAARKVTYPPIIDGDLSEFSGAPSITLTNSRGTTGTYRLLWDDTSLYIAADVSDTQLNYDVVQDDGSGMYNDDAVELMLDTGHNSGSSMGSEDFKVLVNLGNFRHDSRGDLTGTWDMDFSSQAIPSGSPNATGDTDTGYTLEMAIPFSELGVPIPSTGGKWGLEMVMDDQDDAGSRQYAIWANLNDDPSKTNDPDNWGDLLFTVRADASTPFGCIDPQELSSFINSWYLDSTEYPMGELMEAVGLWKAGTGCS